MTKKQDEYDSPWKDVLRRLFPQFLAFFFPVVHAAVDWSREPKFLDKELHKSVPEAATGGRTVDTLVQVWTLAGAETWLLIHIEVQSQVDPGFAERMFIYAYRLYDRHQQLVASLAVLGDDSPSWRPEEFTLASLTSTLSLRFGMVKLLDYGPRWDELAASSNPFALVVMAHLQAVETDQDSLKRVDAKAELMRLLGLHQYPKAEERDLFRFIDWLLQLSGEMTPLYEERLAAMKESEPMTYISTIERKALKEGRQEGLQEGLQKGLQTGRQEGRREGLLAGIEFGLKLKFGDAGLALLPTIAQITDPETLESLLGTLAECDSVAAFQCAIPHV